MEDVKEKLALLLKPNNFEQFQEVRWKEGLQNRELRGPFVVSEMLTEPQHDPTLSAGRTCFREPLDIKVCTLDHDGDLVEFHLDSRRLEPNV